MTADQQTSTSALDTTTKRARFALFVTLLAGCFITLVLAVSLPRSAIAQLKSDSKFNQATSQTGPANAPYETAPDSQRHSPDREGGPDTYGYVFADERDPGGPIYTWRPGITRVADSDWRRVRTVQQTDPLDDGVVTTTLPFGFDFYGNSYTTLRISTNGNVHFGAPNDWYPTGGPPPYPCLPSSSQYVPQAMLAPLWFDFVVPTAVSGAGGVYTDVVGIAPNRIFVVEWRNVRGFNAPNTVATFEALLYENGEIYFQYQALNGPGVDGSEGVIGIQNANGTIGLPYTCYEPAVAADRAIRYRLVPVVFSPSRASQGGAPGATITYSQTLRNQTGIDNSFTLTATGQTWTTTVEPTSTGLMTRGASRIVTVRVRIPDDVPLGSSDTTTVTVSSELPAPGTYTATAVLTTSASTSGVDFDPPAQTGAGNYGSDVVYRADLINRSGGTNSFRITHSGSQWVTSVVPTQTGNLPPEASTPLTITVRVPSNSSIGARDVVSITGTGQLPEPGRYFGVTVITTTAGIWQRKYPLLESRSRGAAVTFAPNGRIYAIGGENDNGNTNLPIEEYDPLTDNWSRKASLQVGVSNVGAAAIGNAIYIPGGYSGQSGTTQSTLQVYYPLEDRVETVTSDPLPQPRFGAGVAAYGGKLYVIGGSTDTVAGTSTVYQYDPSRPAGSRWQSVAPMPTSRLYLGAAALDGLIYAVGGMPGQAVDLAVVEAYNPTTNSWSTRRSMSNARAGLAVVGVNSGEAACGGGLYALGGGWSNYTSTVERYNPTTNSWDPVSGLLVPRRSLAAAHSPSTFSLMALGGWTGRYESITEAIQCSGNFTPPTPAPRPSTPTPTVCPVQFSDVPSTDTFYIPIRCLACRGIVSGYSDGTFRPNNQVTRGQLAKMVSNAGGFSEPVSGQTFQDVPSTHTFYEFIQRLTARGYMSGYVCGGVGEPCINNRPYFRPQANATRGQTSKIVSNAAGYTEPPGGQTFQDVPPTHTFYVEIQRLASRNVMQGYACGGPGEPCVEPENRPYFRPGNDVTRGQSAKIVANAFFPNCTTP